MDTIGYVIWNPAKEVYLTDTLVWSRYVKDAAFYDDHKSAMRELENHDRGLRILEKFIRIDTVTHRIHVSGYEWLTKHVDPFNIAELGGTVNGGRIASIFFPEFEIRYTEGDPYFTISGASEDDFKRIIKEKLKNHE